MTADFVYIGLWGIVLQLMLIIFSLSRIARALEAHNNILLSEDADNDEEHES